MKRGETLENVGLLQRRTCSGIHVVANFYKKKTQLKTPHLEALIKHNKL